MNPSEPLRPPSPFRPNLNGCVGKDLRLARATEDYYPEELASSVFYTYHSLLAEGQDPILADRLDDFSVEDSEHFRMLGKLILALGGNPSVRARICVGSGTGHPSFPDFLPADMLREERRRIDRLQTLLGKSADRVVRSLLSYILADHTRRIPFLEDAILRQKGKMA